jgi:hypothetical protein
MGNEEVEIMSEVRFTTVIGEDRIIRPPQNVKLVPGKAEVIVLQPEQSAKEIKPAATGSPWPLVQSLARAAEELGIDPNDFPPDLAENHDYYAHGAPKGIDKQ